MRFHDWTGALPSFWCAAKSEVRFNIIFRHTGNTVSGADKRKIEFDSPDDRLIGKITFPAAPKLPARGLHTPPRRNCICRSK